MQNKLVMFSSVCGAFIAESEKSFPDSSLERFFSCVPGGFVSGFIIAHKAFFQFIFIYNNKVWNKVLFNVFCEYTYSIASMLLIKNKVLSVIYLHSHNTIL